MRKILLIVTFGLVACGQSKLESISSEASTKNTISEALPLKKNYLDSIPPFDKSVYNQHIDKSTLLLIKHQLPNWELPDPSNWQRFWFKEFMKNGGLVNYISGDFNCDNINDYCILLQNADKEFAVWVLQSQQDTFSAIKLSDIGKPITQLEIGLEVVPTGPLFYIDFQNDNPKQIDLKCPGIQIISFEKAASTYYWKDGNYKSVVTGD